MNTAWIVAFCVQAAATLVLALLVVGLLRRVETVLARAEAGGPAPGPSEGLDPGSPVAPFTLERAGEAVSDSDIWRETPMSAVVFVEPGCAPCESLMRQMDSDEWSSAVPITLVLPESAKQSASLPNESSVRTSFQHGHDVSRAFSANVTPLAFLVNSDGIVVDRLIPRDLDDLLGWVSSRSILSVSPTTGGSS